MKIGVITVSDRVARGEAKDISGNKIKELVKSIGEVVNYKVIPDERLLIEQEIIRMTDEVKLELIIITGGTGLSGRDVTPEATKNVIDKEVPGISEIMRIEGFKLTPYSVLSRGVCGVRGKSLIINLPGNPRAVEECLNIVLPCLTHAIEVLQGKVSNH